MDEEHGRSSFSAWKYSVLLVDHDGLGLSFGQWRMEGRERMGSRNDDDEADDSELGWSSDAWRWPS